MSLRLPLAATGQAWARVWRSQVTYSWPRDRFDVGATGFTAVSGIVCSNGSWRPLRGRLSRPCGMYPCSCTCIRVSCSCVRLIKYVGSRLGAASSRRGRLALCACGAAGHLGTLVLVSTTHEHRLWVGSRGIRQGAAQRPGWAAGRTGAKPSGAPAPRRRGDQRRGAPAAAARRAAG